MILESLLVLLFVVAVAAADDDETLLFVAFKGLHPMILRQPKQHLSQSAESAMMDGPIFIIFELGVLMFMLLLLL